MPGTLVVVGGGRPLPALLKVIWSRPVRLVTVMPPQAQDAVLERAHQLFPDLRVEGGPRLSVHEPQQAVASLRSLFPGLKRPVQVSLTGAPLPLAVAAVEVCREHDLPAWYLDSAEGRLIDLAHLGSERRIRFQIQLKDYLKACGLRLLPGRPAQSPQLRRWTEKVSRHLACGGPAAERFLYNLRRSFAGLGRAHSPLLQGLLDPEYCRVEASGLQVPPEARQVLEGGWLEAWARSSARAARDAQGQPVFTDLLTGAEVEEGQARRELDLVALRGVSVLVASCKTGSEAKRVWLDELNAVARALGQEYCLRIMIHSAWKLTPSYLEQARHLGVVVVTGEQLPQLGQVLAQEMLQPTYGRR